MGNKTSLRRMLNKPALHVFEPDAFWPDPSQFIGVEIEIEGASPREMRTHEDNGMPYWTTHNDASLRNGVEYVLSTAMMGKTLKEAIHYWFRTFKTYDDNPRTSIHVHINMLQDDESLEGLRNMIVLYYMYEDALFAIADETRKWNGYCNPFEDDPPAILTAVMQHDDPKKIAGYFTEQQRGRQEMGERYYGLNLLALGRFGTLEFRHMPMVRDEQRLFDWIKLIMELKMAGNRMANEGVTPAEVFQTPDHLNLLRDYMPRYGEVLLRYTDAQTAFVRMGNINALRLKTALERDLQENKAWVRYRDARMKAGAQPAAVKPRGKSKSTIFADAARLVAGGGGDGYGGMRARPLPNEWAEAEVWRGPRPNRAGRRNDPQPAAEINIEFGVDDATDF
jgi:hypothetical protein